MRIEDILAMEESQTFDRNSHIAEYLKDYKYVKDFGEGVDRMCREMEAQGLPKPEYRQDTFILKAIVKNAGFASKNLGIDPQKTGNAPEKTGNGPEKTGNDPQKTGFALKKREMVEIIEKSNYSPSIKIKLKKIIAEIAENQVLAAKDIKKILDCGATAATGMISRLNDLELLHKVTGKGPGHYILNLHFKDQNG